MGFTGFYWVTLGFNGFHWVLLSFEGFTSIWGVLTIITGFYWASQRICFFYRVLMGFNDNFKVLLGFTEFWAVSPSATGFNMTISGFNRVFTQFYLVLLDFIQLLPFLAGFYRVYLVFRQRLPKMEVCSRRMEFHHFFRFLPSFIDFNLFFLNSFWDLSWLPKKK